MWKVNKKFMGKFIIKPQTTQNPRRYDDAFLWESLLDGLSVYIMLSHRLSLWCWLQCEDILNKEHSLVFIDQHADAREWFDDEEPQLEKILKDFKVLCDYNTYNSFQCTNKNKSMDGREKRPSIIWDNFIYLAVQAKLFKHYYLHSPAFQWDIHKDIKSEPEKFDLYEKMDSTTKHLELNIKQCKNKCIIDIDLDFFDKIENGKERNETLEHICKIIKKYKDNISCITIAVTNIPTDNKWDERQEQLEMINNIFNLDIPVPILTNEEIKIIEDKNER